MSPSLSLSNRRTRYAVVGLGHFAQVAILPAFRHARKNSELVALISDDPVKHKRLGARYKVTHHAAYDEYDDLLSSSEIDAVYIALPNSMHAEYAIRAANAGVHVLCEKPMAMNEHECRQMIEASQRGKIKLMIAYRLHFEEANLMVMEQVKKRKIGEPRFFSSVFSHSVVRGDIRTRADMGGGGLYDIGVYCINAARYLFREEPTEVFAWTANTDHRRFRGVDEVAAAILKFSNGKFAQFTCSQGAADTSQYRIIGTKGDIQVEPAFEYASGLAFKVTLDGKTQKKRVPKRDQIASELVYFSDCALKNREPEPSGWEGLADVRIIQGLYESARTGKPVRLQRVRKSSRPKIDQKITRPPVDKPKLVHARSPSQ